jgi:hypothetical protein
MAGPPARIVLTASAESIPAGRNGIATLSANIVDADGVHVIGANPDLHWKIQGPGTLAGPAAYTTDALKNGSYEGDWYIDTPVGNIARSGASPGTIKVTVEANGLAAGSVTLRSVAPADDAISGIIEPALGDGGRQPVTRDRSVKSKVFTAKTHKLNEITQDYDLPATKDYRAAITAFIEQRNIDLDTSTPEFQKMVRQLADILEKTHGHLVADDYNFLARQLNDARKKK